MIRRCLASLLALLVLTSAGQAQDGEAPPSEYRSLDLDVTFPSRLGGFQLTKVTDYDKEQKGLGVGITYQAQGIKIDVYIYSAGYREIPSGVDSEQLKKEFQAALVDIAAMENMGFYRNVRIAENKDIVSIGSTPFLHAQMTFDLEDIPRISHLYIGAIKNRFLKIRCTFVAADEAKNQEALQAFLGAMAKLLDTPR